MKLIDGKMIAVQKLLTVKETIENKDLTPALAVVLVGDDPASHLYVKLKQKAAKEVGVELRTYFCEALTPRDEIVQSINFLNADPDTHGIIVQLPLPDHLDADEIVNMIDPQKDADGFHRVNQEKFLADEEGVFPVFPRAIMSLIDSCGDDLRGKNAVVLGKSDVFDRVMTHALVQRGCETQFIRCVDKKDFSPKEKELINSADIIVTAAGMPEFVSCDLIKDDTIVIDGGISKKGEKIMGDIAQKTCKDRDIILSPVPGGVGPVTIACLLENAVELAQKQREL
ncbi:MAG: bifunctional 5,10-methylenetetrahydrofolate dehydrogenase/5,10-methenyltetrahydrofolate cyclohydrolase [Parcubacteria group bacterium]|jgi:methylenetetrahydrofolate dehydrogenase (NADP+)/methenyltetrahydrofolate cyclohydrolase